MYFYWYGLLLLLSAERCKLKQHKAILLTNKGKFSMWKYNLNSLKKPNSLAWIFDDCKSLCLILVSFRLQAWPVILMTEVFVMPFSSSHRPLLVNHAMYEPIISSRGVLNYNLILNRSWFYFCLEIRVCHWIIKRAMPFWLFIHWCFNDSELVKSNRFIVMLWN